MVDITHFYDMNCSTIGMILKNKDEDHGLCEVCCAGYVDNNIK